MKVIAIIPIKHVSQRVPGKNYKLIDGYPLYTYILNTLLQVERITKVIVNTDSTFVREKIMETYPSVDVYMRPSNLIGHTVSVNDILIDTICSLELEADVFLQTHTTNPLLSFETINAALDKYSENETTQSLYSVKQLQTRLYDSKHTAINHNPRELIQTQDLPPVFEENSCMYLFSKQSLMFNKHRIGENPLQFVMSDIESQDIDTPSDFFYAEYLIQRNKNKNKMVLITGVCGGIGKATAEVFSNKGWFVMGLDCREGDEFCDKKLTLNLLHEDSIQTIVDAVQTQHKQLHCIVNNAAYQVCLPSENYSHEQSKLDDHWNATFGVNLKVPYQLCVRLRPFLKKSKGSIVNLSSVHATHTSKNISLYAMSKGALSAMTRALALEFSEDLIRVNSVCPGATNTEMLLSGLRRNAPPELDTREESIEEHMLKKIKGAHCLNRIAEPQDIAETVYFLGNNASSAFMTGQSIVVDGGATVRLSTEVS